MNKLKKQFLNLHQLSRYL